MTTLGAFAEYAKFTAALAASFIGLVRFLSGRRDTEQENADTVECHDYVLDAASDADYRAYISAVTGNEIGDQLTVEEAMRIAQDAERRRVWPRNN